ncbi:hypothetical protein FOZ63_003043 [Perkinsus olseni]|uniref:Uncharacterized protein n=1 Tax=Perkinsus olseni TaxID=32597 RepID=A0A7J6QZN6_PEROL|nr:hypothetical protein FOZ62_002204 [Perkinsus olseni]KAF4758307.1 hypothetical protein FOZ63_003043 [Perkinsus olseni]
MGHVHFEYVMRLIQARKHIVVILRFRCSETDSNDLQDATRAESALHTCKFPALVIMSLNFAKNSVADTLSMKTLGTSNEKLALKRPRNEGRKGNGMSLNLRFACAHYGVCQYFYAACCSGVLYAMSWWQDMNERLTRLSAHEELPRILNYYLPPDYLCDVGRELLRYEDDVPFSHLGRLTLYSIWLEGEYIAGGSRSLHWNELRQVLRWSTPLWA